MAVYHELVAAKLTRLEYHSDIAISTGKSKGHVHGDANGGSEEDHTANSEQEKKERAIAAKDLEETFGKEIAD